jgi:hypothetical protein
VQGRVCRRLNTVFKELGKVAATRPSSLQTGLAPLSAVTTHQIAMRFSGPDRRTAFGAILSVLAASGDFPNPLL